MFKKVVWNFLLAGSMLCFIDSDPALAAPIKTREVVMRYCGQLNKSVTVCLALPKNGARGRGYIVFTGFMYRNSGPVFVPASVVTRKTTDAEIQTWSGYQVKKVASVKEEYIETLHTVEMSVANPSVNTNSNQFGKYKNSEMTFPLTLELKLQ